MNPAAILTLLSDLYQQLSEAQAEVQRLRAQTAEQNGAPRSSETTMAANAGDLA